MLRNLVLVMLLAIQVLMATHETPEPRQGIHKDLQPYVDRFVAYGKIYRGQDFSLQPINADIGIAKDLWDPFLDKGTVGWCKPFLFPLQVMIDSTYWETTTELEKEQLVFHELGHCILALDHIDTLDEHGDPVSIMHPYTMDDPTYKKHREKYIEKLFKQEK